MVTIESNEFPALRVDASIPEEVRLFQDGDLIVVDHSALPALISALQAALPDGGWLPIESAPKDGTPILGFFDGTITTVKYEPTYGWWSLCEAGVGYLDSDEWTPTRWRPLPPPPTVSKGDGA